MRATSQFFLILYCYVYAGHVKCTETHIAIYVPATHQFHFFPSKHPQNRKKMKMRTKLNKEELPYVHIRSSYIRRWMGDQLGIIFVLVHRNSWACCSYHIRPHEQLGHAVPIIFVHMCTNKTFGDKTAKRQKGHRDKMSSRQNGLG